jgi:hypothetical protein
VSARLVFWHGPAGPGRWYGMGCTCSVPSRGKSPREDVPLVYHCVAFFGCLLISSILACISSNLSARYAIRCVILPMVSPVFLPCLKRVLGIAHLLGIVLTIIITLPNQIVQLLMHTRIQRCHTNNHALMAVKGMAYGFEMRCERPQSVMDSAWMCSYGVIGRDNTDNHKQGGDAW